MTNNLLLRFLLLLSLGAIVLSVSVDVDVPEASTENPVSGSKEDDDSKSGSKEADGSKSGSKEDDDSKSGSKEDDDSKSGSKEDDDSKSGSKEDDDSKSGSKEDKDSEEEKTTKGSKTTKEPKKKANINAIEKLILRKSWQMMSSPKEDDFEALMKLFDFSKVDLNTIRNSPIVYFWFTKEGTKKYKLFVSAGFMFGERIFTLGKEGPDKLLGDRPFRSTTTFEGSNTLIRDESHAGVKCRNRMDFGKEDMTYEMDCNGKKATLEFEKK